MVVFLDWGFCWKKLWLTCIQTWRKDMHGDVWGCPLPEVYPEPWLGSRWLSYCEQVWNDKGDKLHETNLISSSLGPIVFAPAAAVDVAQWGGNWYGNIVINFQLMIPTCSMCGIFTFSCHTYIVNVGKHIPVPWNIWDLLGQQNLATLLATTAEVLPSLCPWHGLCLIGRCGHPLGHSLGWRTIGTLSLQGRCLRGPLGVSLYQMGMLLVFTGNTLNCQMGDLEDDLRLASTVGRTPFWDGVATLFGHSIDYDINDVDQIHLNCFSTQTPATPIIQQYFCIQSVLPCRLFSSTTAKSSSSEGQAFHCSFPEGRL